MIVADLASSLSDAAAAIVDPLLTATGLIATAAVAVLAGGWFAARRSDNTRVAGPLATIGPAVGVLWLQIVYFPIQGGMYLFGLEMGVLIALVAVGMALIYRANRILNFAQTDLGLVPTVAAIAAKGVARAQPRPPLELRAQLVVERAHRRVHRHRLLALPLLGPATTTRAHALAPRELLEAHAPSSPLLAACARRGRARRRISRRHKNAGVSA